jgi:hypothetical protein
MTVKFREPITKAQFAGLLAVMVEDIGRWIAGGLCGLSSETPMDKDAIRRFTKLMRQRLDHIENWETEPPAFSEMKQ